MLSRRIEVFTALPLESLNDLALRNKLHEIGRMEGATDKARQSE
jgi:hypothetical protein